MSKRQAYLVKRYGQKYGPKGCTFVARAWDASVRYFENHIHGDRALNLIMDQIVRVQKLGGRVIQEDQRQASLAAMWEVLERVNTASEYRHENPPDLITGGSPEFMDFINNAYDPSDHPYEEIEQSEEPEYIHPELAPVRHSQAAWEAFLEHLETDPEQFIQTYRVLWQLWRLKGGQNFLSWIS